MNRSKRLKQVVIAAAAALGILVVMLAFYIYRLNGVIVESLSNKRFIPPIEFYSAPQRYFKGQKLRAGVLEKGLKRLRFRLRHEDQQMNPGDYIIWNPEACAKMLGSSFPEGVEKCVAFRNRGIPSDMFPPIQIVAIGDEEIIFEIFSGNPPQPIESTQLEAELFAQFVGVEPMLKQTVELGDTPPLCLNALLAIEDSNFLEHQGISIKAIGRAILANLTSFKVRQGGSTITQQLVKNYFLTHEKTLRRKFKEFFMAILLELHATKDDILQSYINEIYMGQNGSFQVRGFGSAAEYYFGKPLAELELADCALLAAIVNSPGLFSPYSSPERAGQRRELVLAQMVKQGVISEEMSEAAKRVPLPKNKPGVLSEPAPFFVDAVQKQLDQLKIDRSMGVRIFTTLDLNAQEAAQDAVRSEIDRLEKDVKKVAEFKAQGKNLEGVLISSDPQTGYIQAVVGGRSFKKSQFNRAIQSHRQVGSVIKPFVFLAALEGVTEDGQPYTPTTLVNDDPLKVTYEKQVWAPQNYEKKYYGTIPLYFGLKMSLNSATARVAMQVGLEPVLELIKDMGIQSPMKALPALALGAFELYPWEVLQAYSTLARMGEFTPLTYIVSVEDLEGKEIFRHEIQHEQVAEKADVAVLVGMMKQTIENGTGYAIRQWKFNHPAAGKTGTTSDNKDAWFAGFTPLHVAISWVGYDDNTSHGLTGASGAIPIWAHYMLNYAASLPPVDFTWPEDVEVRTIDVPSQQAMGVPADLKIPLSDIQLVFKK